MELLTVRIIPPSSSPSSPHPSFLSSNLSRTSSFSFFPFVCFFSRVLEHSRRPYSISKLKRFALCVRPQWPWRCIYYYGEIPLAAWSAQKVVNLRCYHNWRAYMQSFQPDIVVSVHPLCQVLPLKILDDMGGGKRKIPFVTVVTDLGSASRMWFHKGVDRCCVPGDAVEKLAFKNGLKPGQVKKHGLPVRQGFWRAAARRSEFKQARASLKLKDLPTVLVVGGGDGVGGLQKIALGVGEKLAGYAGDCQLVVVCGKNEKVKKALQAHPWASNVNVQVEGFVSNMDDYMVAADILVTKAGPGTIAEVIYRKHTRLGP